MPGLRKESAEKLLRRLEAAEDYLSCVLASQAGDLSWSECELIAERLRECEDFVTLADEDWQRICNILCPERFTGAFRRYSAQALETFLRLCQTVCPELFGATPTRAAPTSELPGTWAKVAVMESRADAEQPLFCDLDARLTDEQGFLSPQGDNGKKDARIVRGEAVDKLVIALKGEKAVTVGRDQVAADPDWYKLRAPQQWYRVEVSGDEKVRANWLEAARREGFRVSDEPDASGTVTLAAFVSPSQVGELARTLTDCGVSGAITPLHAVEEVVEEAPAVLSGAWGGNAVSKRGRKRKQISTEGWLPGLEG